MHKIILDIIFEMRYDYKNLKHLGMLSSIGFIFVGGIVGGFLLGWWLDIKFNTKPILTLIFLILGIAFSFVEVFRILRIIQKSDSK